MPTPVRPDYDSTSPASWHPVAPAPPRASAASALRGLPFAAQAAALAPVENRIAAPRAAEPAPRGPAAPMVAPVVSPSSDDDLAPKTLSSSPLAAAAPALAPRAPGAAPSSGPAAGADEDALGFDEGAAPAAAPAGPAARAEEPALEEVAAPPPPAYEVDGAAYSPTKELGSGAFGRVQELASQAPGAKKLVVKQASAHPDAAKALTNETDLHRSVPAHPHIVPSVGVRRDREGRVTDHLMEHASGGDATHTARNLHAMYAGGQLRHAELHGALQHITRGTARGLQHLAGQGVLHNDIKGDNVMLGGPGGTTPQLGDFGIAGTTRNPDPMHTGTRNYIAPERYVQRGTPKSDVYSLGHMAHVLTTGKPMSLNEAAARQGVELGPALRAAAPAPAPGAAAAAAAPAPGAAAAPAPGAAGHRGPPRLETAFTRFVDRTMAIDPAARPDAAAVQRDPYLDESLLDEAEAEAVIARAHRHARGEDVSRKNRPIDFGAQAPLDPAALGSHVMKNAKVLAQLRQRAAGAGPAAPQGAPKG